VVHAVDVSESQVEVGQESRPHGDPDAPGVAELLPIARHQDVHAKPGDAVREGRGHQEGDSSPPMHRRRNLWAVRGAAIIVAENRWSRAAVRKS
jgi:hypothetical protein